MGTFTTVCSSLFFISFLPFLLLFLFLFFSFFLFVIAFFDIFIQYFDYLFFNFPFLLVQLKINQSHPSYLYLNWFVIPCFFCDAIPCNFWFYLFYKSYNYTPFTFSAAHFQHTIVFSLVIIPPPFFGSRDDLHKSQTVFCSLGFCFVVVIIKMFFYLIL